MLIHEKLQPGLIYPQLTKFPTKYADFLAAFRGGQTVDNNMYLTTANTPQTTLYKAALLSGHLRTEGNPILGEFLLDIFLTDAGAEHILVPQDRQFCEQAVELAKKSVAEDDRPHPYVGVVIVKDGKILATGYRGESGDGAHGEYCALKKINDDVDKADLSGCTVYTTLEPCSKRSLRKTPCATRLINAKAAQVVSGMPDKDKEVYGLSSLAEAGIHIRFFPSDLMQELLALNKEWSETRRKPEVMPPPNDTNAIADVSYNRPGTSMLDNIHLYVRPPKDARGFYTVEDTAKNVLAHGRTLEEIGMEWRRIDGEKVFVEKLVRQGYGNSSGSRLLNFI
jgi:pyrimidine deaminase RibD-like protein